jgi:hypothetical protein
MLATAASKGALFPRNPRQRVLPALLLLIDGAALVRAQRVRESVDQDFRHSVSYHTLNDRRCQLDLLLFALAGRLAEPLDQRASLVLGGDGKASIFIGLFGSLRAAYLRICVAPEMRSSMLSGVADGSWLVVGCSAATRRDAVDHVRLI